MNLIDRIKSWFSKTPDKLFYPGQEITLKLKKDWQHAISKIPAYGPKFGEVVKVIRYDNLFEGKWYIKITGYPNNNFDETAFVPVLTDDQLEEMLNEIDQLTIRKHEI